ILALMWTGIANTLVVSGVAMMAATVLGFLIGIARLSTNWLLSTLAGIYVEVVRNIPLLFFVLFWYFGVIAALPGPRNSISLFAVAFLNNRGLTVPTPNEAGALTSAFAIALVAVALQLVLAAWARRRRDRTGRDFPVWSTGLALLVGVPLVALTVATLSSAWNITALGVFSDSRGI